MFTRFKPKSGNAKIKNAVKAVDEDGVKCDSRLELYMRQLLRKFDIPNEFQKKYELQPSFRYLGEAIRPITLTVDFWIPSLNVIIDTKGFQTDPSKIKTKMLKWLIWSKSGGELCDPKLDYSLPTIHMPRNKKQCEDLAILLKSRMN